MILKENTWTYRSGIWVTPYSSYMKIFNNLICPNCKNKIDKNMIWGPERPLKYLMYYGYHCCDAKIGLANG
jgi:hypothetical protein